jgi:hypothetical protein
MNAVLFGTATADALGARGGDALADGRGGDGVRGILYIYTILNSKVKLFFYEIKLFTFVGIFLFHYNKIFIKILYC